MPRIVREASVTWQGSMARGSGALTAETSGAFVGLPYSFPTRIGNPEGRTSPEELLAAAHAACFSMALASRLAKAGTPPERLDVSATVTFVPGTGITSSALEVIGTVPGIDEATFVATAEDAKDGCPVSGALKGNVELSVSARLG
jgi:osmotically inducible protein OsmC